MKTIALTFLIFTLGLASLALAEDHRGGSFGGGGGESSGSGYSGGGRSESFVSPQLHNLGVRSVPRSYTNRTQLFTTGSNRHLSLPSSGPRGETFRASFVSPRSMSSVSVRNNMGMVTSANFRTQIRGFNAHENIVGRYYWHNYNGLDYCHFYDRWGCNWYGWNCGSGFYWSCWWGNNWWWYDPAYYRWCYWYDGWWWWQNPDNVTQVYVYNNGDYVPSNSQETQAAPQENQAPVAVNSAQAQTYSSKDGTRMVKIAGDTHDAFLYDTSEMPGFKTKYLASGVKEVRFSNKNNGGALQIMLGLADGSFELYDADGNSIGNN